MGSAKSKTAGEEEDNSTSSQEKHSFSSIQNSASNNSLGDDYLVINTKTTAGVNRRRNLNLNKNDEFNQQNKIRPHSLFDETNVDFKIIDTILPDTSGGEPGTTIRAQEKVTSFQPANKSQYFRSFRYASRRIFGNPNSKKSNHSNNNVNINRKSDQNIILSNNESSHNENSGDLETNKIPKNFKDLPAFEKIQKSKSQTDLDRPSNRIGKSNATQSGSNLIDSDKRKSSDSSKFANNHLSKHLRNSFTSESTKPAEDLSSNRNNINNIRKLRDLKMKDRVKNLANENKMKSPVPSLSLENPQKTSSSEENQDEQNENMIEHLKKQINSLNAQLENIEREDSKIINELSEKIDNIAKMNINTISSVGNQRNSHSRFRNLFGKSKHSPQVSPNSSQASFTGDYYTRLQAQNDSLLQQQYQIEQLKQQLLNSAAYQQQHHAAMNASYVYYPNQQNQHTHNHAHDHNHTCTHDHNHDHTHNHDHEYENDNDVPRRHDHATEEDESYDNQVNHDNVFTHHHAYLYNQNKNYYNPRQNFAYSNQSYVRPNFYSNSSNQYYANGNTAFYYQAAGKQQQFQHQQSQTPNQQFFYNPQNGKYYFQKSNVNVQAHPSSTSSYYYDTSSGVLYQNQTSYTNGYANQNSDNSYKEGMDEDEDNNGVIITEVDDDENEFDLEKMKRDKFKDYVDAISLKDD